MKPEPQSEKYKRFETLLGAVLGIPKAEITRRTKEDKCEKRTPKLATHPAAKIAARTSEE